MSPAAHRGTERSGLAGRSVVVVGGAGFIGSHLVDRIVDEEPGRLTVIDNLFLGRQENLAAARRRFADLRRVEQDATDIDAMDAVLRQVQAEIVFNLAVVPLPASLERPRWSVMQNVALATVACELLRLGRFRTLVHFSSSEAYGSAAYVPMDESHPPVPSTPYAASKLAGDQVVLSYWHTFGLDAAIVRPFNNFGPRQNSGSYAGIIPIVVDRATRGEPIEIHGDGEQTRDFVFVRDTADAAIRVHGAPATRGRVVNVASGREVSVNELVKLMLELLGADVEVRHVAPRPGDVRRHLASIDLARELIGYEPGTSLREGMAETIAWYLGR
ncbi:MAG TPA: NAD-dependent epimerase/dehydratase family protein [Candidatus Angelobacter sp.]|nr:NAD-dependent epimerase/dehydratase family protein [Candidatus Angelobacter sp.]